MLPSCHSIENLGHTFPVGLLTAWTLMFAIINQSYISLKWTVWMIIKIVTLLNMQDNKVLNHYMLTDFIHQRCADGHYSPVWVWWTLRWVWHCQSTFTKSDQSLDTNPWHHVRASIHTPWYHLLQWQMHYHLLKRTGTVKLTLSIQLH